MRVLNFKEDVLQMKWRSLQNEELHEFYISHIIVTVEFLPKLVSSYANHTFHIATNFLCETCKKVCRSWDNINMDFRKIIVMARIGINLPKIGSICYCWDGL